MFTIAIDIHDEVLARETLTATQLRLNRFTENIPYPLTYVDRNFVLRFVNKAYTEASRTRSEDPIGHHIGKARGARRWAGHEPYFQRALQGRTVQYTRLVNALPQGPRWMRTNYVPDLDDDGTLLGVYTVTIDVHDLTVSQEKLKRRVERDALTDVLSRRTMMDHVEAALVDSARQPVALYFVDLDGFKTVNDRLGHREGDALLVAVGEHCRPRCARKTRSAASAVTSSWCSRRCATPMAHTRWRCTCWRRCSRWPARVGSRAWSARASATPWGRPTQAIR